jgi:hypothetical protein
MMNREGAAMLTIRSGPWIAAQFPEESLNLLLPKLLRFHFKAARGLGTGNA